MEMVAELRAWGNGRFEGKKALERENVEYSNAEVKRKREANVFVQNMKRRQKQKQLLRLG